MIYYAVDRLEGKIAVVVGDDGQTFDVPRGALPKGSREGSVLKVAPGSPPNWAQAELDEAERLRRLTQARDTLRRLGESDDGGDVQL